MTQHTDTPSNAATIEDMADRVATTKGTKADHALRFLVSLEADAADKETRATRLYAEARKFQQGKGWRVLGFKSIRQCLTARAHGMTADAIAKVGADKYRDLAKSPVARSRINQYQFILKYSVAAMKATGTTRKPKGKKSKKSKSKGYTLEQILSTLKNGMKARLVKASTDVNTANAIRVAANMLALMVANNADRAPGWLAAAEADKASAAA